MGRSIAPIALRGRNSGRAAVRFTLPKDIAEGRGQVAVVVKDGGNVETVAITQTRG